MTTIRSGDSKIVTDDRDVGLELESLESVTHGALVSITGAVGQKIILFLTNLVLTHSLGVSAYGLYAFGYRLVRMLSVFAKVGTDTALLRFVPKYDADPARQGRVLGLAYGTALVGSVLFVLPLLAFAPRINELTLDHPEFVELFRTLVLLLPLLVLIYLTANLFRSLERAEYSVFVVRLALPGGQLLAVATAVLLGYDVFGIVAALVVAAGVTLAGALWLTSRKTSFHPTWPRSREEISEFLRYALPVAVSQVGGIIRNRVDVFLVGVLLSASAAGIYNVALFLSSFIALSLLAFNQLFPPIASKLYSRGNVQELDAAYSVTTRWILSGGLVVASCMYVYRTEFLGLFGAEYTAGSLVLTLFIVGQLVNCAVGPAGWLLQMTDHQYLNALNNWALGILNVGFSYYFVLELGLIGAAIGTASSLAIINVVRVVEIWHLEGLFPYTRRFIKPLVASLGMGVVMAALGTVLSGPTLLAVGVPSGVVAFLLLLRLFGIEQRDRQLAGILSSRYQQLLK